MLVLAIDTSGKQGSIALARGDATTFELIGSVPAAGGTFSAQLVPQISALLSNKGISKNQLEGLCAASGPGSFTGLRVGLAAIKGLAETLQKPIAAVSVLQALAHMAASLEPARDEPIVAVIDAGRGEVYLGKYRVDGTLPLCIEEKIVPMRDVILLGRSQARFITADAKLAVEMRAQGAKVMSVEHPGSGTIARLGIQKILRGEMTAAEALDANYIRKSDAELFSLPKK
jgi:tRNA threonylcarbamoyladenosine biosynthesis protein TsaB